MKQRTMHGGKHLTFPKNNFARDAKMFRDRIPTSILDNLYVQ